MSEPALVLLHGLGRTTRSMRPLETTAAARGYTVLNLGYPSRSAGVESLAASIAREILAFAPGARLHFVTHSMGGIILRAICAADMLPLDRVGRVVMLAPPNQGSGLPDALGAHPLLGGFFRYVTGPAGSELGSEGIPVRLPPVAFELGVIAGDRSLNPVFARVLAEPNDGKVSVRGAAVEGMRDFLVVPHSHSFIMRAPLVIEQTLHFLEHGEFARATDPDRGPPEGSRRQEG